MSIFLNVGLVLVQLASRLCLGTHPVLRLTAFENTSPIPFRKAPGIHSWGGSLCQIQTHRNSHLCELFNSLLNIAKISERVVSHPTSPRGISVPGIGMEFSTNAAVLDAVLNFSPQ
jgi:hypothetical protein